MPKTWFRFKNAADCIELSIEGEIGAYGVSAKDFKAALASLDPSKKIVLSIYSAGGEVFEGHEIYNALKAWKAGVETKCGALVASIATVIACAGSKVTMAKNGLYMIHNPWGVVIGEAADLRKTAEALDKLKNTIVAVYVEKTGKSEDELAALMDEETWFESEDAKATGFVDAVGGEEAEEPDEEIAEEVMDSIARARFKNAAPIISRLAKKAAGKAKAEAKQPPKPKAEKEDIMKRYNAGAIRVFNRLHRPTGVVAKFYNDGELSPEEAEKRIKDEAKKLFQAKLKRDREIWDIVNLMKERDKRDFSALAEEFIAEDKTPDEFLAASLRSDKFKAVTPAASQQEIEVIEPLDSFKNTPGYEVVTSEEFKASFKNGKLARKLSVETQNSFAPKNVATGTTKTYEQRPGIVDQGVRPLTVEDLLSSGSTEANTVTYLQETEVDEISTDNVAESGTLHQADVHYDQKTAPVADLGDFIPVPEGLLSDLPALASLINRRLPYLVDRSVEWNLLNADGTGGNFTGILQSAGLQSIDQADVPGEGDFRILDLLYKMLTKIRWQNMDEGKAQGGFEPDGFAIHPIDWEKITLLKDAVGQYYRQNPFASTDGQDRVWGKLVAVTPAVAQGSPLAGAFKLGGMVFNRQGMLIEMTNSDGTNFQKRIITIRAARRLALTVDRPACFVEASGVNPL